MPKKRLLFFFLILIGLLAFTPVKENKTTQAGIKMQDFVIGISNYAHSIDSTFIIIPQNGPELAFEKMNPAGKLREDYLKAIDGIAVEDLFYNEKLKTDTYRLNQLRKIKTKKQVLFSDFIPDEKSTDAVKSLNEKENFLFFSRGKSNEHYREIPGNIPGENANDIVKLSDAKNYLYLINPIDLRTKHLLITTLAATNYDMIAIDLFYNDRLLTAADIAKLQTKANGGKRLVLSYVNIGAAENWRYYWKPGWQIGNPGWIKKRYAGYDDEFYVQFWHDHWRKIIYGNNDSYVKKIIDAGFDGAFLDNVEGYYFLYNK